MAGELGAGLRGGVGQRFGDALGQGVGADAGLGAGEHVGDGVSSKSGEVLGADVDGRVDDVGAVGGQSAHQHRNGRSQDRDGVADLDAKFLCGGVVDENLARSGRSASGEAARSAAAGGGVVAEDVGGELTAVGRFEDAGGVAQPFGPGHAVHGGDGGDGGGEGRLGHVHGADVALGDEHVGG